MAIIYSYPYVSTVNNSDTLVISVSDTTADNGFLTKSLTADNLASYVTARVNLNFLGDTGSGVVNLDTQNLTISGTSNEIETSASSQTLQIGLPDSVTITNNLTIGSDLTAGRGAFISDASVGDDLTVGGVTETSTLSVNSTAFIGGVLTMEDNISMTQNGRITDLEDPINAQDAATKSYVDGLVSGGLSFRGSFRADTGEILSGINTGSYLYNCPGGAGTRVSVVTGDYYIVANAGGNFYCSGDLLNVGDSIMAVADAPADSSTINDWATLESDNIEGTGLANTIPLWTDSQVLGNSNITQNPGGSITISENLLVDQKEIEAGTMIINGVAEITGELDKGLTKIVNLADPTAVQDAATKAYVDAVDLDFTGNSGTGNVQQGSTFDIIGSGPITTSASGTTLTINSSAAEGTGTTQTLPVWSDGPNGVLSDSVIKQNTDSGNNVSEVRIDTVSGRATEWFFNGSGGKFTMETTNPARDVFEFSDQATGFYENNFQMRGTLAVGRSSQATAATLDVGNAGDTRPAAFFRNGVVISNSPGGVQVDNTSMVIGAGNNDNISGSDHCLIVGSGNQITVNSDQSVAFGQGNSITNSTDAFAVGNSNTLSSSLRTQALGFNNTIQASSSFIAGGDNNISTSSSNIMVLGYDNSIPSGNGASAVYIVGSNNQPFGSIQLNESFGIGNFLTLRQNVMTLGYRNSASSYPTPDKNLGLGETKFVVSVGSSTITNANALIITEGGINGGSQGTTPQIPRVILPTIVNFNFADDTAAAAGGIPVGGLYHNAGALRIRLT